MLSYMLPMEESSSKPPNMTRNFNLSLNPNGSTSNGAKTMTVIDETTKLLASERSDLEEVEGKEIETGEEHNPLLDAIQREDSFDSDGSSRIKMNKLHTTATKSVALKR